MNKNAAVNPRMPAQARGSFIGRPIPFRHALLVSALLSPLAQSAQAVEIYYARAIGHDFLPETAPSQAPAKPGSAPQPELPGLGTQTEPTPQAAATGAGMSTWSKVLIGAVVVGAVAALANKGGGGSDSASGGPTPPDTGASGSGSGSGGGTPTPPTGGGGGIGIGGGGLPVIGGGNRGRD